MSYLKEIETLFTAQFNSIGIDYVVTLLEDDLIQQYDASKLPMGIIKYLGMDYKTLFSKNNMAQKNPDTNFTLVTENNLMLVLAIVDYGMGKMMEWRDKFMSSFIHNCLYGETNKYYIDFSRTNLITLSQKEKELKAVSFLLNIRFNDYYKKDTVFVENVKLRMESTN